MAKRSDERAPWKRDNPKRASGEPSQTLTQD